MKLSDFIDSLSLKDYIATFGSYRDRNESKPKRFKLWPKQEELCDYLDGEGYKLVFIPKSRQSGISEVAAERAIKTMFANPGCEGIVFSKSEDFAKYFLEVRIKKKIENLPKHPGLEWPTIKRITQSLIELSNGSTITSLTSSETGSASMSVDFAILDEMGGIEENHKDAKQLFANMRPSLDQNKKSWIMCIGTSVPGTYYNDMVEKAYMGNKHIKYFFVPWMSDPKRDAEWERTEREILGDNFYLQYPATMEDFFYVKQGLVFKNFDAKEGGKHINAFTPNWNYKFITAYDHGYNDPACVLFALYDPYSDHLYFLDETYYPHEHNTDVNIIGMNYKKKLMDYPKAPSKQIADTQIFNKDRSVVTTERIFARLGIRWTKSIKWDARGSRELLSSRFTHNKITIHPRCVNLIDELRRWRWDSKKDKAEPENGNDHSIDPARYICAEIKTEALPSQRGDEVKEYLTKEEKARLGYGRITGTSTIYSSVKVNSWQSC